MNTTRRHTLRRLAALAASGSLPWLSACGGSAGAADTEAEALDALASSRRRQSNDDDDDDSDSGSDSGSGSNPGTGTGNPPPQPPSGAARIVVMGGGMGGATLAKYLRMWSEGQVAVTLVDRDPSYLTCIHSSMVLSGQRTLANLTLSRSALASTWGVQLVQGNVSAIDAGTRTLRMADGSQITGDRLVLAPGVDFDRLPGLDSDTDFEANPHAWKAGAQTTALAAQLRAMPAGGRFVVLVPPTPYRCPPGPYERACLVADWLRRNKPGSKVLVLDHNPGIVAEVNTFTRAFTQTYAGTIEYVPNAQVQSIDAATKTVRTSLGDFRADVLNPIPSHRAPKLLADAGLVATGSRWAGIDALSYESTAAPGVHVIGDAGGTSQPKSGHIANQQAKVCADAIIRALRGQAPDPAPMTSSACYTTVSMTTASWLNASFAYDSATRSMKLVPESYGESSAADSEGFSDMEKWFRVIMADTFA